MKYSYLILIILLFSCLSNDNDIANISSNIRIATNPKEDMSFHSILDSVITIPLEFTEESALSRIGKVRIWDNKIFVLDEILENIFIFNSSGKFVQKFESFGKGAGEILSIKDMDIDTKRNQLLILSGGSKSIHIFNISDLSFVDQMELPFIPSGFIINQNMNHLAFHVGYYHISDKNFHITDRQGNVVYAGFQFPHNIKEHDLSNLTGGIQFGKDNTFLYSDALSNEINEVTTNGKILNRYDFSFDINWPKEDQYLFEKFVYLLREGNLNFLGPKFAISDDYLMFTYNLALSDKIKNFAPRKGYFHRKSQKVLTQENFPQSEIIHSLSGPLGMCKDFFISALYPSRLLTPNATSTKLELQKYGITDIEPNDNPVLFLHTTSF